MQHTSNFTKQNRNSDKTRILNFKKRMFFENLKTSTLMLLSLCFLLLSITNNNFHLTEIIIANIILIPLLSLKILSENPKIK